MAEPSKANGQVSALLLSHATFPFLNHLSFSPYPFYLLIVPSAVAD